MLKNIYKDLKRGYKKSRDMRNYPEGTKPSFGYRLRHLMIPHTYRPAYLQSLSGAKHYLSEDPLDDRVLEEILHVLKDLFFPKLSAEVEKELNDGGVIMDVGAFNAGWGIEMLAQYPGCTGIFLEPSPEKCQTIPKSFEASGITSRTDLIPAGLASKTGDAWLVRGADGSWADWLVYEDPGSEKDSVKVPTVNLDDALKGRTPTVIKSNSEGGEYDLVRQLIEQNMKPKMMILMVHPEMGDAPGLEKSLIDAGFKVVKAKDHPRRPVWHVSHS